MHMELQSQAWEAVNASHHTIWVCGYQHIVLSLPPFHLSSLWIPTPFLAKIPENILVPSPFDTQGRFFWTLQFPLDHQLCLPPSCYKYQRWDSRGARQPSQRLRARIWQNQEWNPRFWTLILSRCEISSPGGTLKVSQKIINLIKQATESCCRPGSRSVKSCFRSLDLKVNVQDKLGKRERNWWNGDTSKGHYSYSVMRWTRLWTRILLEMDKKGWMKENFPRKKHQTLE